jgi:4-aminobutyrate aminotransferase/(S)-3-amino-2-methylpropionate transaminase
VPDHLGAENLVALIIEPIQGEGGFIVPADGFLPALARCSLWSTKASYRT